MKLKRGIRILMNICLLSVLFYNSLYAQNNDYEVFENLGQIPSFSPNVAALMEYVEVPVNEYNGLTNISIPLYNVLEGDISLPISLSYHSGGIKVNEEASWAGLGWSLNAGGVISRIVRGNHDEGTYNRYFNRVFPQTASSDYTDPSANYDENHKNQVYPPCSSLGIDGGNIDEILAAAIALNGTSTDGEPDIFAYNFGSFSGKFMRIADNVYFDISKNNVLFSVYSDRIDAITPDGFKYIFGVIETAQIGVQLNANMSYYLTEIESPTGKHVYLDYKSFAQLMDESIVDPYLGESMAEGQAKTLPNLSEQFLVKRRGATGDPDIAPYNPRRKEPSGGLVGKMYLDRIRFSNGYINFDKSARGDCYGFALDNVEIFRNDNSLFKRYNLMHTYFTAVEAPTLDYLHPSHLDNFPWEEQEYPVDFRRKRLKLHQLVEESYDKVILTSKKESKEYTFEYNDEGAYRLPYKTSFAKDFWGYYNGRNNSTFIPDPKYFNDIEVSDEIAEFEGANRLPHSEYIKAGTLKKIIYPTKGSTEFDYSIHSYDNIFEFGSINSVVNISHSVVDPGLDGSVVTEPFDIDKNRNVEIFVQLFCTSPTNTINDWNAAPCNCYGDQGAGCTSDKTEVLYAMIERKDDSGNFVQESRLIWSLEDVVAGDDTESIGVLTETVNLEAGEYRIKVNYPDQLEGSIGSKMAYLNLSYDQIDYTTETIDIGGGLRVDQVVNHDPVSNKSFTTEYQYSGGVLLRHPVFYWNKYKVGADYRSSHFFKYFFEIYEYLYADSAIPFSSSASGSAVGYSSVKVKNLEGDEGWQIFEFENEQDLFQPYRFGGPILLFAFTPGMIPTPYQKNGFLIKNETYRKDGKLVKSVTQDPLIYNPGTYWNFKLESFHAPAVGPWGADIGGHICANPRVGNSFLYFYPTQMGRLIVDESRTVEYFYNSAGEQNAAITEVDYSYNEDGLLASNQTTTSGDNTVETTFKYPNDYTTNSGWIGELKDKNMITNPIEVKTTLEGSVIKGNLIFYDGGGLNLPSALYKIETSTPDNIPDWVPYSPPSSDFEKYRTLTYDEGNLSDVTGLSDDIPTSYLWGYEGIQIIAKCVNCVNAQMGYTSFEGNEHGNWQYDEVNVIDNCDTQEVTCQNIAQQAQEVHCAALAQSTCIGQSADCYDIVFSECILELEPYNTTFSNCMQGCSNEVSPIGEGGILGSSYFIGDDNQEVNHASLLTGDYIVSCWAKMTGAGPGSILLNGNRTEILNTEWKYIEIPYNGAALTVLLNSVHIDELKIWPVDAQITTFTYDPLIGIISETDTNGKTTYYEYDEFGRLIIVKDHEGYVLKSFEYNYKN